MLGQTDRDTVSEEQRHLHSQGFLGGEFAKCLPPFEYLGGVSYCLFVPAILVRLILPIVLKLKLATELRRLANRVECELSLRRVLFPL